MSARPSLTALPGIPHIKNERLTQALVNNGYKNCDADEIKKSVYKWHINEQYAPSKEKI